MNESFGEKPNSWCTESQVAADGLSLEGAALSLIDYHTYFRMLGQAIPSNQESIVHALKTDRIIEDRY